MISAILRLVPSQNWSARLQPSLWLLLLLVPHPLYAQDNAASSVPVLIRHTSALKVPEGYIAGTPIHLRFILYSQAEGGDRLWQEEQAITPDGSGRYSVLLGAATTGGVPVSLFAEQEQRWLGIQIDNGIESKRVLLVSVPYAFMAREAETLAGHPAEDFVTSDRLRVAVQQQLQQNTEPSSSTGTSSNTSDGQGEHRLNALNLVGTNNTQILNVEQDGGGLAIQARAKHNTAVVVQSYGGAGTAGVQSTSANGAGLSGLSTSAIGSGAGVQGSSAALTGYGVHATETSTTGLSYGLLGSSASTQGVGVSGTDTASTGATVGVEGSTASTSGAGVVGDNTASMGTTYGLMGTVNSPGGIAGYFQSTPGGKLISGVSGAGTAAVEQFSFDGKGNLASKGGVFALGNIGAGIAAPQFKLHVADSNFVVMRADGSSPIGTWLQLNNTSAGGHNLGLLSTGAQNLEGAGNLTISDQTTLSSIASFGNQGTTLRTGLTVNAGTNLSNVVLDGTSPAGTSLALNNGSGKRWELISTSNGNVEGAGNFILFDRSDNVTRLAVTHDGNVNVNGNLNVLGSFTPSGDLNTNTGYDIAGARILNAGKFSIALGAQTGNLAGAQSNTLVGAFAGQNESTGNSNTLIGVAAGQSNTAGNENTFIGADAGEFNTTGNSNASLGTAAALGNTTGAANVAVGNFAGFLNQTGNGNVAIGSGAGSQGPDQSYNISIGGGSNMSPGVSNSTAIGTLSKATQSNSLILGSIAGVNLASADTNVGIGTTAPQSKLHIVDANLASLRIDGSNSSGASIALTSSNPNGRRWEVVSTSSANLEGPGQLIIFDRTDNRTRMILSGDGTVSIPGNLNVGGTIAKGGGSFRIDDPLDPANKTLSHSFVESPDMMNIYNGSVRMNTAGEAWVEMPAYFEALNGNFQYQLTAIGRPGPGLYVARRIRGNRFKIAGGKPGMEVSWQVTGVRHDVWADAHRIPIEEDKTGSDRGAYLHPDLFPSASVGR